MSTQTTDIEKFDRAVYSYLSSISEKIVYAPTNAAVKTITKREKFSDNKPWNFISFYRDSHFDIDWSRMNNYGTRVGDMVQLTRDTETLEREARYVQNIPLNLTYQVDLWASKAVEVQKMSTSLISKLFMEDQVLEVPINPDGENGRFHMLDISWNDNSDLERESEIGKIYRHTIEFTVDGRLTLINDVQTVRFKCGSIPINIYE